MLIRRFSWGLKAFITNLEPTLRRYEHYLLSKTQSQSEEVQSPSEKCLITHYFSDYLSLAFLNPYNNANYQHIVKLHLQKPTAIHSLREDILLALQQRASRSLLRVILPTAAIISLTEYVAQ